MIDLDMLEELYNDDISRASEWIPDLLTEVLRLRIIVFDMFYTADELEAEKLLFDAVGHDYNYKQMIADFKEMMTNAD